MRIIVGARITPVRDHVLAHAEGIDLAGGGQTEEAALVALRRILEAWCRGLIAGQTLEPALQARGVQWVDDGDLVTVDLQRT